MRRAVAMLFAIALGPGCLCLQTPDGPAHERASGAGGGGSDPASSSTGAVATSSGGAHAGGGSSGGFGGVPPPPAPCVGLWQDGPVVEVAEEDDEGGDAGAPALVALDATIIAIGYAKGPGDGGTSLMRLARVGPWDTWPPAAVALTTLAAHKFPLTVTDFALGGSGSPESFSVLYHAPEGGIYAAEHADPLTAGATHVIDGGDTPLFIRAGAMPGSLAGYAHAALDPVLGPAFALGIAIDVAGDVPFRVSTAGCASTPLAADAVATPSGVMLAAALGQPLSLSPHGRCSDVAPTIGPARMVSVAQLSKNGAMIEAGDGFDAGAPVDRLSLAARSDGAWIAIEAGSDVSVGRLDALGGVAAKPRAVAPPLGVVAGSLGTASVGDALVVALSGGDPTTGTAVAVGVATDGAEVAWAPLIASPGLAPSSPVAVLASTDARYVLAAWSAPGANARRIHLARLRCEAAP